jgi:hypothetical protein
VTARRYSNGRRDENEPAIVAALRAAGAAVQQLDPPLPDLLVSYRGELHLLEVKRIVSGRRVHVGTGGDHRGLTPAQHRWWATWRGRQPVIVLDAVEALAAIGVAA